MNDVGLEAVSETLFFPLYALALESRTRDPILRDQGAVALTEELNALFGNSDLRFFRRLTRGRLPKALVVTLALRIRRFDAYVREFLQREPDAVVVCKELKTRCPVKAALTAISSVSESRISPIIIISGS